MRFDLELARSILLKVEELHPGDKTIVPIGSLLEQGADKREIYGHLIVLEDGGFIDGIDISHSMGVDYHVQRITYAGHEFLNSIRDESIWRKTLDNLAKISGSTSLDVVVALAISFAKQKVGLAS